MPLLPASTQSHSRWNKRHFALPCSSYLRWLTAVQLSGPGHRKPHTLQTVHASIQEACQSLEAQIADIETETERALAEVQEAVGALSDLRYGRFASSATGEDIGDDVLATLKQLEAACTSLAD
jgi:centromere-localized protein 2